MPLLYSSPILFYPPPPPALTTIRHFPPQRLATCPSSSLRRRFASEPNPLPLHSAEVFRNLNWQCNASRPPPYQCRPRSSPLRPPRFLILSLAPKTCREFLHCFSVNFGTKCCIRICWQKKLGVTNKNMRNLCRSKIKELLWVLIKGLNFVTVVINLHCRGDQLQGGLLYSRAFWVSESIIAWNVDINYVSAHDNETLFDIVTLKTPMEISLEERFRINHSATSIIALGQYLNDELLRSKSLDRDLYSSGDWFNRSIANLIPKLRVLNETKVSRSILLSLRSRIILAAVENFSSLLRITIRYSSPLFRLRTANVIQVRGLASVLIIEDGHEGVPGLSQLDLMSLTSADEIVKRSAYDASLGCFTVPPRTTSVFVKPQEV
ncbi:unnamed protein product [Malus baccata var. baccata]